MLLQCGVHMRLEAYRRQDEPRTRYDGRENARAALSTSCAEDLSEGVLTSDPFVSVLECFGCGAIVRNSFGMVTGINRPALRMLECNARPIGYGEADLVTPAVERFLAKASGRLPADGKSWVTVQRDYGRPIIIYQLPVTLRGGGTVLILVDLDARLQPKTLTLQRMFGLTAAEGELASAIAAGATPTELARERRVSRATVRSQLARIFAKTRTHRQPELVALLARVSLLP